MGGRPSQTQHAGFDSRVPGEDFLARIVAYTDRRAPGVTDLTTEEAKRGGTLLTRR